MDELEEHERQVAFDKKYVLRRDYERDLKLAKHNGIVDASIFLILILPSCVGVAYFIYLLFV